MVHSSWFIIHSSLFMVHNSIKCIAFDVGGVLLDTGTFPENVAVGLSRYFHLITTDFLKTFNQILPRLEKNSASLEKAAFSKNANNFSKIYQNLAEKNFKINSELLDLAIKLKKNYEVGILSNVDRYLADIPKNKFVYSCFNPKYVVLSYKEGERKPEKKLYKIFLYRINCKADECLFIDNLEENIKTAQKIGMKTILFKNNSQIKKELKTFGVL